MSKSCLLYEKFFFRYAQKIDAKDVDNIDIIINIQDWVLHCSFYRATFKLPTLLVTIKLTFADLLRQLFYDYACLLKHFHTKLVGIAVLINHTSDAGIDYHLGANSARLVSAI